MTPRSDRLRQAAREALPHFVKAWGSSDEGTRLKEAATPEEKGQPEWVRRLEREIRREIDPEHPLKGLYARVIGALLDISASHPGNGFRTGGGATSAVIAASRRNRDRNPPRGPKSAPQRLYTGHRGDLGRRPRALGFHPDVETDAPGSRFAIRRIVGTCLHEHLSEPT